VIVIPIPDKGESQKDFISRCIPFVINEGTTDDSAQASAICYSIWRKHKEKNKEESDMSKRIYLKLCTNMFKPLVLKDKPQEFHGFDRATMIVGDGTYNGIYFPADELEKAFSSWENQPVNLDHSDKAEDEVGFIKEVVYDKVNKKITAKPFLNNLAPKAAVAAGFISGRLNAGTIPEVSVGVWVDREDEEDDDGNYRVTARNLQGDHLALVTRGACSPKDGCGIGMSANNPITIQFEDYVDKNSLYEDLELEILKEQIKKEKLKGGKTKNV